MSFFFLKYSYRKENVNTWIENKQACVTGHPLGWLDIRLWHTPVSDPFPVLLQYIQWRNGQLVFKTCWAAVNLMAYERFILLAVDIFGERKVWDEVGHKKPGINNNRVTFVGWIWSNRNSNSQCLRDDVGINMYFSLPVRATKSYILDF